MARTLIDTFRALYEPISEYFRSDEGQRLVGGAAKGFISGAKYNKEKQRVKEVPYDFAALRVKEIGAGGEPIKINTLRVATFANSISLYSKYDFLFKKGLEDNIVIPQSVNPGGTRITSRPQYRQGSA